MSVIDKYPFINAVLTSLSDEDLASLQACVNGQGAPNVFKSILADSPNLLTNSDKGVYPVDLEVTRSGSAQTVYPGFLIFNDDYCVLISFATERQQILTVLNLTRVNGLWKSEIKPFELSITDLRSELFDVAGGSGGGGGGGGSGLPDTTPSITLTSETITLAFNEGVLPTHIKLSNGIIVDLQGNEYCAEGDETVAQSINSGRVVIVISGDFTSLPSVDMTNLVWTLIDNPSNFSFDDLPRFSDSSDVDDFPDSSGGDTPSSASQYDYIQMCFNNSNNNHIIIMLDKKFSRASDIAPQVNQLITTLNQMGSLSIPAYNDLEDLEDIADYLNMLDTQTYAQIKVIFWASVLSLYPYLCLTIKGYDNGAVTPTFVEGIADLNTQSFAYTIKMMDNTGAMVTRADEQTIFDFDVFVNDLD